MSSNQKGIGVRQALEILSQRSASLQHENDCHHTVPEHGPAMGQVIDLEADTHDQDIDQQQQQEEKERQRRREQLESEIAAMTVGQLIQTVLEAQQGRVHTYQTYNRGLETVLQSRNLSTYPPVCASATAEFAVWSDTINSASQTLREQHARGDLSTLIAALQGHESEKLQLTAALHLERMRKQAHHDGDHDTIEALLEQGVRDLRSKIVNVVEQINDDLEELRCAAMEEHAG